MESKTRWVVLLPGRQGANHQRDSSHPNFRSHDSDIREHLQLSEFCTVVTAQASCRGHRPLFLLPERSRRPLQVTVGAGPLTPPPRVPARPRRHPPMPGLLSVRLRGCWATQPRGLRGSGLSEGPGLLPQISRWWGRTGVSSGAFRAPGTPAGLSGEPVTTAPRKALVLPAHMSPGHPGDAGPRALGRGRPPGT